MKKWHEAIALRIADEWSGKDGFSDEAEIIQRVLLAGLEARPELAELLIGSGVIEADYFWSIV